MYGFEKEPYKIHTEVVAQAITALSAVGELGISRSRYTNIVPTVGPRWMVMKMAKYIEADRLREAFLTDLQNLQTIDKHTANLMLTELEETPAADVAPVIHGTWLESISMGSAFMGGFIPKRTYFCSECGLREKRKWPYCHCGAKMDGDEDT